MATKWVIHTHTTHTTHTRRHTGEGDREPLPPGPPEGPQPGGERDHVCGRSGWPPLPGRTKPQEKQNHTRRKSVRVTLTQLPTITQFPNLALV